MSDVIIVGAGITGLSCAWRLKRLGIEPLILESSNRAGGVIQSERVGDYLIEHGPNTLLPTPESFAILDESGLTSEILEGNPRAPRYVYLNRKLRRAPFGPMSTGGLLRALEEPFIRSKSPKDESIHHFFVRRFGREAEARLVSPFVTGIYAGNTRELSMAATFPRLVEMERQYGSLVTAMVRSRKPKGTRRGHTCSFADGMEVLPRRLAADANISYDTKDLRISRQLEVTWHSGKSHPKAVIVTVPAHRAIAIFERELQNVARFLEQADYAPMVIATTSIADRDLPQPLRGFGFLVPRSEKLHLLGTLFSSALFPGRAPQGRQLLTSFIGGAFEREAIDWPEDRVWDVVRSELQTVLKTTSPPDPVRIVRHTRAIPQYRIGHEHWTDSLRNEMKCAPGLFLGGNYMDGVSVAACMETGERIASEVAAFLKRRSRK